MRCFESYTEPKTHESYLCVQCGYMSLSLYKPGSDILKNMLDKSADIVGELQLEDKERDMVWLPSVLNMGEKGIIYPEGKDKSEWCWKFAGIKKLNEEEQKDYPIPNQDGKFYTQILDVKSAKTYDKLDFFSACQDMGIVKKIINDEGDVINE
jgi:hypothetical protein